MNFGDKEAKRLEKVLARDKKQNPAQIEFVLKSDLVNVLENYFDLKSTNISFDVVGGEYIFCLSAKASHIKNFGKVF